MDLVKLNIVGYSHSEFQHGAFALILSEEKGNRTLSIVIGACEAQSIAIGLETIKSIKNIINSGCLPGYVYSTSFFNIGCCTTRSINSVAISTTKLFV